MCFNQSFRECCLHNINLLSISCVCTTLCTACGSINQSEIAVSTVLIYSIVNLLCQCTPYSSWSNQSIRACFLHSVHQFRFLSLDAVKMENADWVFGCKETRHVKNIFPFKFYIFTIINNSVRLVLLSGTGSSVQSYIKYRCCSIFIF